MKILREIKKRGERLQIEFECDCGNIVIKDAYKVRSGHTQSCGCLKKEIGKRSQTHGHAVRRMVTREYRAWRGAKGRCHNPDHKQYKDYGARGIIMCKRWRNSFGAFYADMGPCPNGMTLERLNNNKGYKRGNCKWKDRKAQNNNTRRNYFIEYDNRRLTMAQWGEEEGISRNALQHRIARGQDEVEALKALIKKKGGLNADIRI